MNEYKRDNVMGIIALTISASLNPPYDNLREKAQMVCSLFQEHKGLLLGAETDSHCCRCFSLYICRKHFTRYMIDLCESYLSRDPTGPESDGALLLLALHSKLSDLIGLCEAIRHTS